TEPLKIHKPEPSGTRIFGSPYLVNYAMSQLASEHNGRTGFGSEAIYGGWKIVLTIDSRLQKLAEDTLRSGVHHYGEYANQGGLICLDTHTGEIRAMVGGLDYKRDQYNAMVQGARQPGSSFKPIVYAAAFDTDTADLNKTYRDDPDI